MQERLTYDQILQTEYFPEFDDLRKKAMATSYYKYGSVEANAKAGITDFTKSLDIRYEAFKKSRNTEYLVDIANMCMMIWRFADCFGCHYRATDSGESPGIDGMTVKDMEQFAAEHYDK